MNRAMVTAVSFALVSFLCGSADAQGRTDYPDGRLVYSFKIPPGWIKDPDAHRCCGGVPKFRVFHPRAHKDNVTFYILIPFQRSPEDYSTALRELLAKPAHKLDATERKQLRNDDDEDYEYRFRKTVNINGKRVYVSERRELDDSYVEMVVRVGRHDRSRADDPIEEIHYVAPAKLYPVYLPVIQKTLDSICWH